MGSKSKIINGIKSILIGAISIAVTFYIFSFLLGFVSYILIEEKLIEGNRYYGYIESIKLAFQYKQVLQFFIIGFIIFAGGLIAGIPKIINGFKLVFKKGNNKENL